MNKLISADIPRVLRSKITIILVILTAFMAFASVMTASMEADEGMPVFPIASSNLVLFLSMLTPVFSGGLSIMLISGEFSSGVIRNKFIMGHKRRDVLLSWAVIYSVTTLLTYAVYVGTFFIAVKAAGIAVPSGNAGNIAVNLLILLLFVMKFQMFSLLMVCIYPDAKTAVICYLLNNATIVPMMLASLNNENSKAMKFLSRIFIFGYTNGSFTLFSKPDKPWLTAVLIAALSALYMVLADMYFRRKDLK